MEARRTLIILATAFALATVFAVLTTVKQVRTEASSVSPPVSTI